MADELPFWSTGRISSPATLKKYGLSLTDWIEMFNKQKGCCAICKTPFGEKRINVDHAHVKGWKKMAPEQRREFVRGLLCYQCNKFMVMRGVTSTKLWNAYFYMRNFEVRITAESLRSQQVGEGLSNKPKRTTHQKAHNNPKHTTGG